MSGPLIFKIYDTISNPFSAFSKIGNVTLLTLINQTERVDTQILPDPFQIVPGHLFNPEFVFEPSTNYFPNPTLKLRLMPQHVVVLGTQIQVRLSKFSESALTLYQKGFLTTCKDMSTPIGPTIQPCKLEQMGDDLVLTIDTNQNTPKMTPVSFEIQNVFERAPRFKGKMTQAVTITTMVMKQLVDESAMVFPEVERATDFETAAITLASNFTREPGSIVLNVNSTVPVGVDDKMVIEMSAY